MKSFLFLDVYHCNHTFLLCFRLQVAVTTFLDFFSELYLWVIVLKHISNLLDFVCQEPWERNLRSFSSFLYLSWLDVSLCYSLSCMCAIFCCVACTDHMFWGRRDVMKVAAYETWPAISSYFEGERKSVMSRSFLVTPLLESLRAVPSEYWTHSMELIPWKMVRP